MVITTPPGAAARPGMPSHEFADRRAVVEIEQRLVAEYPEVPPEVVHSLIDEGLQVTANARVQTFRTILAERHARERLRSWGRHPAAAPASQAKHAC